MIIDVAVPYRVPGTFHYLAEENQTAVSLGSIVKVSFGKRSTHAFVLGFPASTDISDAKMKPIQEVLIAEPLFDARMLKFLRWISEYYCHPLGEVIAAAVPRQAWMGKLTKKRVSKKIPTDPTGGLFSHSSVEPDLTEEQSIAVSQILDEKESRPCLLHGVTGSGKTEVYMRTLAEILKKGKGAIILVPEIALTPQLLGRFSSRFGTEVAVLHSDLTPREKHEQWDRIRLNKAKIVVGARSAIFAPVKDLGLIVVDEEHEASFKQEDSVRYHARDVAIVRGQFEGARVILGSATPSLESFANAKSGRYAYVTLKKRVKDSDLPTTTFVDLKDKSEVVNPKMPWISRTLLQGISDTLAAKNQTLVYLNRLGFAHFLYCEDCGHSWRCRNCEVALTYYKASPSLRCHYCGDIQPLPGQCEVCAGVNLKGMGFGTEQVERSLVQLFPQARIARMDRSCVKTRKDLEDILRRVSAKEVDILIGTQMIAKGHDFPGIALVGILLADASLNLPDFRANERTFQIITQVAGRAGRAEIPGRVIIQTMSPNHPVLAAAAENRSDDFFKFELESRKLFAFPPYQRLAMIRLQHRRQPLVEEFSHQLATRLREWIQTNSFRATVHGPAEAPMSKVKNLYRWQCLLKGETVREVQRLLGGLHEWLDKQKSPVDVAVDVDPVSSF